MRKLQVARTSGTVQTLAGKATPENLRALVATLRTELGFTGRYDYAQIVEGDEVIERIHLTPALAFRAGDMVETVFGRVSVVGVGHNFGRSVVVVQLEDRVETILADCVYKL